MTVVKQIDFLPTIITEAGLRSAGVGRIDLAETLNRNELRTVPRYFRRGEDHFVSAVSRSLGVNRSEPAIPTARRGQPNR